MAVASAKQYFLNGAYGVNLRTKKHQFFWFSLICQTNQKNVFLSYPQNCFQRCLCSTLYCKTVFLRGACVVGLRRKKHKSMWSSFIS